MSILRRPIATALIAIGLLLAATAARAATQINEIRTDHTGSDSDEYFELIGTPLESLNGLTYIVLGDSATLRCGFVECIAPLNGWSLKANGLLCLRSSVSAIPTPVLTGYDGAVPLNFENSDNVTHMLVSGFTGFRGQDLDSNDDGVLDVTPWTSVLDCVGLFWKNPNCAIDSEYIYCATKVGPDGNFVPGHVYRCRDTHEWKIGQFNLNGGADTPGQPNHTCALEFLDELREPCVPLVNQAVTITATVRNATGGNLYYTLPGQPEVRVGMTVAGSGDVALTGTIPGYATNGGLVRYYVKAFTPAPDTLKNFDQGYFVGTVAIASLRVNDANESNLYRNLGARVRGNVTAAYGVLGTANTEYYLQDATSGVKVFKFGPHEVQPVLGDDITVAGAVDQFNGELEITVAGPCDSVFVVVNEQGSPPAPRVITTCELGEDVEGTLVAMNRQALDPATDTQFQGNKNYNLGHGWYTGSCPPDSIRLFIDLDSNIPGTTITTDRMSVVGIAGQFDFTPPYAEFYEIIPRSTADITFIPSSGVGGTLATELGLLPSWPNPFSRAALIRYRVPGAVGANETVPVRLAVFDLHGRRIATLVDGAQAPGEHEVSLDRKVLERTGSGIYFYRLEAGWRTATRSLVFIK